MKYLNRSMVAVEESVLMRHVKTKVVEVELASVTDRLQSMVARTRNMQHNLPHISMCQSPVKLSPVQISARGHTHLAISSIIRLS